jgi:hypothetical protein
MTTSQLRAAMATTDTGMNTLGGVEDDEGEIPLFRRAEEKVRPGDIVRLSPWLKALKSLQHLDAQETTHKGRTTAARIDLSDAPLDVRYGKAAARLIVDSKLEWGALLTRGCDVDHGKERQIVVLRSLKEFNLPHHAAIINGEHVGLHYIPEPDGNPHGIGERVADFRFIATLHRDVFDTLERTLSLTPAALMDLYFGWMRHTIGKRVPDTAPCPSCGTLVDVFRSVEELATPSGDY